MINTCTHCGEIVLKDKVCPTCYGFGIRCPSCGKFLTVMSSSQMVTEKEIALVTLYHCDNCNTDWERKATYIGEPVKFTRKIWG